MKNIAEIKQAAKAYRKITSRKELGVWDVQTNRPIVERIILDQEKTRQQNLIPIRRERMSASPFAFFRGSAAIQAYDLSSMPGTPFTVQACGDAHISNFGIFASPERRMVFDINDFDETLRAPFDVDIKRLAASMEICGRHRGFSRDQREAAVFEASALYRKAMIDFSDLGNMEVWYRHLDLESLLEQDEYSLKQKRLMHSILEKASLKTSERAVEKYMETAGGRLQIKSNPPLIVPVRDMICEEKDLCDFTHNLQKAFDIYKESLPKERLSLIDQYEIVEVAHKVAGIGSVGRKAWILVLMGRDNGDPLVLQIKEAEKSVLELYYGSSPYRECGRRVVEGQRAIQTAGDILLGWFCLDFPGGIRNDCYVRQLWDSKGSADLDKISLEGYQGLSLMCAWTLAHSHAKTGNRHSIAGYLGQSDAFEHAMVRYASSYADQNEADYAMFLKMSEKPQS